MRPRRTGLQRAATICAVAVGGLAAGAAAYLGLITGAVPVDLGIGRRTRPLGPLRIRIAAPRETVFDAIAAPYGERTTRALREKVRVLERGTDMVLAAHYTPIRGSLARLDPAEAPGRHERDRYVHRRHPARVPTACGRRCPGRS